MSNKDLELQQDCNAVIHELEKAISNIKAACIEPDLDTAEKAFNGTLSALMEKINGHGDKKISQNKGVNSSLRMQNSTPSGSQRLLRAT